VTNEHRRLDEARTGSIAWKQWGPYLSERQWGIVREDYSENGDAWNYEYFHGENGAGLGASHQTGWTGLVATLIQLYGLLDAKRLLEAGKQGAFVQGTPAARDAARSPVRS
jgi:hypothetical protein